MKMGSAATEDAYCLKWNDFHTSITASFSDLRNESDLLDAVVVCEGQQLRAHRLVLSACSGVFRQLFRMSTVTKNDNPVVLLWDVKADDLKLLINFMYEGQVNVAQERLSTFLALAERLQVRGLTTSDKNNGAPHPPTTNNRSSGVSPAKSSLQTPSSGRRLRSSPMGVSSSGMPSKRHRPHMVDTSDDLDDDDMPPVKQELKVDENSVFTAPTPNTPGPDPAFAAGNSSAGSSFSPFFGGSNPGDGFEGSGSAGPSSMQEGFGLEPGQMIEEGSKGSVVVGSLTVSHTTQVAGVGGLVGGISDHGANSGGGGASLGSSPVQRTHSSNSGVCHICNKTFRQLRSHIVDVHIPTPTACPLCGKVFSSKHKMFGHKYRSCPNRTKNLVRHLELLDRSVLPGLQQQQIASQLQQQQQEQQDNRMADTPTPPDHVPPPPASQPF